MNRMASSRLPTHTMGIRGPKISSCITWDWGSTSVRMVGAGQERRRRQQVPSPPAVPGLCPPGAPEPARARGRGMDTPLGPRWLPARGDRAAWGWAALFRGAGAHTYVPGGRVARASVGDFLALQQAHHPLEVPGVNDSSVVTGLPGILPVELLWGDGSGRGPPHPRIGATTGRRGPAHPGIHVGGDVTQ